MAGLGCRRKRGGSAAKVIGSGRFQLAVEWQLPVLCHTRPTKVGTLGRAFLVPGQERSGPCTSRPSPSTLLPPPSRPPSRSSERYVREVRIQCSNTTSVFNQPSLACSRSLHRSPCPRHLLTLERSRCAISAFDLDLDYDLDLDHKHLDHLEYLEHVKNRPDIRPSTSSAPSLGMTIDSHAPPSPKPQPCIHDTGGTQPSPAQPPATFAIHPDSSAPLFPTTANNAWLALEAPTHDAQHRRRSVSPA